MNVTRASRQLASYIRRLEDFDMVPRDEAVYTHAGAALSDAVLQCGLNYRNVVWPRIHYIVTIYARQCTVKAFRSVLLRNGAKNVLRWRDDVKPARLLALVNYCIDHDIETCQDIAAHLRLESSRVGLLALHGVGPKTVDYLSGLVGVESVAVDRHVFMFTRRAGIPSNEYEYVREAVGGAARLLGVSKRSLDYSIWAHGSN